MALVQDTKIKVQGFLDSLSGKEGSVEEDLLAKRRQSISQSLSQVAAKSPTPFKTSLATLMGDTLGKGLLRAFNIEDEERQRAIDIDQANKLIAELSRNPNSTNLFKIGEIKAAMNDSVGAAEAFGLAREVDQQTEQDRMTNIQRVNVANQLQEAGLTGIAARVGDQTLSPKEGLAQLLEYQKAQQAANTANAQKNTKNVEIKKTDDGRFVLIDKDTGTQEDVTLPPDEQKMVEQEELQRKRTQLTKLDSLLSQLDRIEEVAITDDGAAGPLYPAASMIPTTSAYELSNLVTTVKANLSFDELQRMREASPTGGALGQVSNIEIGLLQNAVAALNPGLGEEAFQRQLNIVKTHYSNVRKVLLGEMPEIDYSRPEYEKYITEDNGKRYFEDPLQPGVFYDIN